jgi:hypothetical protein
MTRQLRTLDAGASRPSSETTLKPNANMTTALLVCGVVAGPLYLVVSFAQAFTRDGFDLSRHLNVTRGMGVRFLNPDRSEWQPRHRPHAGSAPDNTDRAAPSAWARLRRAFTNRGR